MYVYIIYIHVYIYIHKQYSTILVNEGRIRKLRTATLPWSVLSGAGKICDSEILHFSFWQQHSPVKSNTAKLWEDAEISFVFAKYRSFVGEQAIRSIRSSSRWNFLTDSPWQKNFPLPGPSFSRQPRLMHCLEDIHKRIQNTYPEFIQMAVSWNWGTPVIIHF